MVTWSLRVRCGYVCVRVIATTMEQQRCYFRSAAQVHVRMSPIVFSNIPHKSYCDRALLHRQKHFIGPSFLWLWHCGATKGRKCPRVFVFASTNITIQQLPCKLTALHATYEQKRLCDVYLIIHCSSSDICLECGTLHLPFTILSPFNTW